VFWGSDQPGVADDNRGAVSRARAARLDVEGIEVAGNHQTMVAPAMARAIAFFGSIDRVLWANGTLW
jgi:hypothetical protein